MASTVVVAVVIGLMALGGCGGRSDQSEDGSDPPATSPAPDAGLVELHVTGGIAGVDERLVVTNGGDLRFTSTVEEQVGTLTPEELDRLRGLLADADFDALPEESYDPDVRDAFGYTVTHGGRTVSATETVVPDELNPLLAELRSIMARFR